MGALEVKKNLGLNCCTLVDKRVTGGSGGQGSSGSAASRGRHAQAGQAVSGPEIVGSSSRW